METELKFKCGIEIHTALTKNINTKLFCSCNNKWQGKEPNTLTCPTCLALPGAKPVVNKEAIEEGLKVCLALNCKVPKEFFFSRKVYEYPDLPGGYQRTQYEIPIGSNGYLKIKDKKIRIKRINLEEDPGRLIHKGNYCLIDYNRSGTPLCEIVTEPDFRSTREVRIFLQRLSAILESYLDVFDSKLDGTLRVDANISTMGERIEIKNITSFKDVELALEYEIERQKEDIPKTQQTRGWNQNKKITVLQRIKETEEEYGFIFDADLVGIEVSPTKLNGLRKSIPELSLDKITRFKKTYALPDEDAETLASEKLLAELFEEVAKEIDPKLAARWLRRDLLKVLHYNKKSLKEIKLDSKHIIELLSLLQQNKINDATAKDLLIKLIESPFSPEKHVKKEKLTMIESKEELETMCQEVIKNNPEVVSRYKAGKKESLHYLVGQIMRLSKGKADPKQVQRILKKLI